MYYEWIVLFQLGFNLNIVGFHKSEAINVFITVISSIYSWDVFSVKSFLVPGRDKHTCQIKESSKEFKPC